MCFPRPVTVAFKKLIYLWSWHTDNVSKLMKSKFSRWLKTSPTTRTRKAIYRVNRFLPVVPTQHPDHPAHDIMTKLTRTHRRGDVHPHPWCRRLCGDAGGWSTCHMTPERGCKRARDPACDWWPGWDVALRMGDAEAVIRTICHRASRRLP